MGHTLQTTRETLPLSTIKMFATTMQTQRFVGSDHTVSTSTSRTTRLTVHAVSTAGRKKNKSSSKEFCFGLPGNTAPMGDFDPLEFARGADENTMKRYREAELTHGRVSMVASLGFIVGENFNPLFDGSIKGPAVNQFQQVPTPFWIGLGVVIAAGELTRATTGWVPPGEGEGANWLQGTLFQLKDDYVPGDIGWDPLGLKPTNEADFNIMQTRELNNGRIAMFAIAGMVAQEKVTGLELFNLQDDGILIDANCAEGVVCNILEASG